MTKDKRSKIEPKDEIEEIEKIEEKIEDKEENKKTKTTNKKKNKKKTKSVVDEIDNILGNNEIVNREDLGDIPDFLDISSKLDGDVPHFIKL